MWRTALQLGFSPMNNFTYFNPVKIVFGKDTISQLPNLISQDHKVILIYGGGSIKRNGVYDQVIEALKSYDLSEFGGIEPNPQYDTCVNAVHEIHEVKADYLLAVGGGSVIDAVKFIAAAVRFPKDDLWDICTTRGEAICEALPFGCVLTLPASGSEMNSGSVISRASVNEKRTVISPHTFPQFSILDPQTTCSLPQKQLRNGIVDSFVHVVEQYVTYDVYTPLQDRQAEAILHTLIEIAPYLKEKQNNYDVRASFMWCAAQALNGLVSCGCPVDFASHDIGHELTAFFGITHAETIAAVLPALWRHQKNNKREKLVKYGERVWNINKGDDKYKTDVAIEKTVEFFQSIGMPTQLRVYGITNEDIQKVIEYFRKENVALGEHCNITYKEIAEILAYCL